MLAIMNVGKYSSSGTVPSGSDLFVTKASQSLGQALDFYARKNDVILGLPYQENTIYKSADGGSTWSTISSPYYLAHIFYSPIEDKFYALEMGDETTTTLHYGVSTDGSTWTWNTIYEISTAKVHIYGTFIEEANGSVAFDVLKVDSTTVTKGGDVATASHIRAYIGGSEEIIGSEESITVTNATSATSVSDFYPLFTFNSGKTNTSLLVESWKPVGYSGYSDQKKVIGSWGIANESPYSGTTYTAGNKCFDKFYWSLKSGSSSSYTTSYSYSPNARPQTFVQYRSPSRTTDLVFNKIYGFFQVGNYFYMAYQYDNASKWYRAGDIETLINVAVADTFAKSDLTGVPVSELTLDNKHFLLSMSDGKVYLCEAT